MMDQDWLTRAEKLSVSAVDSEGLDVALALHMTALADLLHTGEKGEVPSGNTRLTSPAGLKTGFFPMNDVTGA